MAVSTGVISQVTQFLNSQQNTTPRGKSPLQHW